MATTDWYTELVATTLEMPAVTGRIGFKYAGFSLAAADYKAVAKALRQGATDGGLTILRTNRNQDARGWFNGKSKTIGINHTLEQIHVWTPSKPHGERLKEQSTWVHEATHAVQALKHWKMTVGQAEVMAHLAQAMFLCRYGDHLLFNPRLVAAGAMARKLSDGDPRTQATQAELQALVTALKAIKVYRERWDKVFHFAQDLDAGL